MEEGGHCVCASEFTLTRLKFRPCRFLVAGHEETDRAAALNVDHVLQLDNLELIAGSQIDIDGGVPVERQGTGGRIL